MAAYVLRVLAGSSPSCSLLLERLERVMGKWLESPRGEAEGADCTDLDRRLDAEALEVANGTVQNRRERVLDQCLKGTVEPENPGREYEWTRAERGVFRRHCGLPFATSTLRRRVRSIASRAQERHLSPLKNYIRLYKIGTEGRGRTPGLLDQQSERIPAKRSAHR